MVLFVLSGSGYDNGTGSWVEQSNDVNVNNLHVVPPVSFDCAFICSSIYIPYSGSPNINFSRLFAGDVQ